MIIDTKIYKGIVRISDMSLLIEASGKAWGDGLASIDYIEFFPARIIKLTRPVKSE